MDPDIDKKNAAISSAQQYGWSVTLEDCVKVDSIPPKPIIMNDGGRSPSPITPPVTEWWVYINPKSPPNKFSNLLKVKVGLYPGGNIVAKEFDGPFHE
jgi:hypothetical protein